MAQQLRRLLVGLRCVSPWLISLLLNELAYDSARSSSPESWNLTAKTALTAS